MIILYSIGSISFAYAATVSSVATGLIPGQIWYSTSPLVEGSTVKIHTGVWNGDTNPLQARVEFYDQDVILGTRDVTVPTQTLQDVSVSWDVTAGDHLISAKIISSSIGSGKTTQNITLERSSTNADHTYVPVVVKTSKGVAVTGTDVIKTAMNSVSSQIASAVPQTVSNDIGSFDDTRSSVSTTIENSKTQTQKDIDSLNAPTQTKITAVKGKGTAVFTSTPKPSDPVQKPLLYVKLFLLSVAGFIFKSKIVFYGLIVLLVFIILRFFYRKIKNR